MTPIYRYCSQKTVQTGLAPAGRSTGRLEVKPRWRKTPTCAADLTGWVAL